MDQEIVWNYYEDSLEYLLRIGMNQNNKIIFQCLLMNKFDNNILEAKITKDEKIERILESNNTNKVFFVDLNTYDIRYNKEKKEYELYFIKNGQDTFGPVILKKQLDVIDKEFKKKYINKYKDYIEKLKKNNKDLKGQLDNIIKENIKIKKINEYISKRLKEVEKQQNESLTNPINSEELNN